LNSLEPLIKNLQNKEIIQGKIEIYKTELLKWNKKINLVSRKTQNHDNHFLDSVQLALELDNNINLIDIGTGAGFPGLVISIVNPSINITVVEPNNKKFSFLFHIISLLKLNVKPLNERVELHTEFDKIWDVACCKAFTQLDKWDKLASPLAKTLYFFASSTQKENIFQPWKVQKSWNSPEHGTRYLLKKSIE
jgi:16S rRNA (guanine527-N7)-methyltransferase